MALRAVPDHPKFAHLKALLNLGKGATLGYLECIWHFTGRFTPQGNIGKYSDSEIENWVEWPGEPGALINALVESRWIDPDEGHRLLVHDWDQHADKATKNALKRAKSGFLRPTVRTPSEQRTDAVPNSGNISRLPEPVPEPEPEPNTLSAAQIAAEPHLVPKRLDLSDEGKVWSKSDGTPKRSLPNPEVETVLEEVSRRVHARHPAIRRCGIGEVKKQLRAIARGVPPAQRIGRLRRIDQNHAGWCASLEWQKDGGTYAKGLANWLAPTMERWNEPPPNVAAAADDPQPPRLMM